VLKKLKEIAHDVRLCVCACVSNGMIYMQTWKALGKKSNICLTFWPWNREYLFKLDSEIEE